VNAISSNPVYRLDRKRIMNKLPLLCLEKVSKAFPGVQAVNKVDFSVDRGEVVSLVGQNGAGKSTLVSIVGGIYNPDNGEIFIDGKKVRIVNPAVSEELGIGMVHQEPTLVPSMTVAANMFLNREVVRNKFVLDFKAMRDKSINVLEVLGFKINPDSLVESLTLVEREVVEIAKAMLLNPKILILDEVTSPLGPDEVHNLFELIEELKSNGMAIIFITHRLKEVTVCSDRIVVLSDGNKVGELYMKDKPSEKEIIKLMLGDKVLAEERKLAKEEYKFSDIYFQQKPLLEIKNLTKDRYFRNINFSLYKGEILGFAGLKGSGITEIFKAVYGILPKDNGDVFRNNQKLKIARPIDAIKNGIGMITNDRQKEGLALCRNVIENVTISYLDGLVNIPSFLRLRELNRKTETQSIALDIKATSLKQEVLYLSGGNQQKVVIAKWLLMELDIIIVDEPTRGVDVKAISEIHKLLVELKEEGKGIIITSPEIHELLSICDRILIIASGEMMGEVKRSSKNFRESYILEATHRRRETI